MTPCFTLKNELIINLPLLLCQLNDNALDFIPPIEDSRDFNAKG